MRGCSEGPEAGRRLRGLPLESLTGWGAVSEAPPDRVRAWFWGGQSVGNCTNRSNCPLPALVRGVAHQGRLQGSEPGGFQKMCPRPRVGTEAGTWHRGPGRWWRKEWLSRRWQQRSALPLHLAQNSFCCEVVGSLVEF